MPVVILPWILGLSTGTAASPAIGTVTAGGAFRLNGDTVMGNGTLTEGSVLETGPVNSSVRLAGGARLFLVAQSRGKVYSDRIILEKGETRLENGVGFRLEALGLTIRPERGLSTGRIGLLGSSRVRVAALTGSFRVWNARGVLVANVAAGSAVAFEPQAANAATHVTGVLTRQNGHFLLTDEVTKVTVEVTGPGLERQAGLRVEITGTVDPAATPVSGASQVVVATQVKTVAAGAAGGGGAAPAGTGGAAGGVGVSVTTVAVIGGVAAAATLGGLAASDALPGQGGTAPESR
jgi:hypothetical protein